MNNHSLAGMTTTRRRLEYVVRFMVFYSIGSYFLELELTPTRHSQGIWLWNERLCAAFFTAEYFVRWFKSDNPRHFNFKLLSVIDLMAVIPFYIAFLVDDDTVLFLRSLRVLRLFKLVRYSPALFMVAHSLKRVKKQLKAVSYLLLIVMLLSTSLVYHFEHRAQPEKWATPSDGLWFTFATVATVGYGDMAPITLPGRIVTVLTMVTGIGIFSILVSLLGSAFLTELQHEEEKKHDDTDNDYD